MLPIKGNEMRTVIGLTDKFMKQLVVLLTYNYKKCIKVTKNRKSPCEYLFTSF
jgi:hypothetical protein